MKNINKWTLYNMLALYADTEVCALAKDIIDENGYRDIDDYKDDDSIDGIHVTVWVDSSMKKSYAMRAVGIGFRETTNITAQVDKNSICLNDHDNNQFLTIYFLGRAE